MVPICNSGTIIFFLTMCSLPKKFFKLHSGDQKWKFGNSKMNYLIKTHVFIYFHLQKPSTYIISLNLPHYLV